MLTADVSVEGFEAPDWLLLGDLLAAARGGDARRGGVVVLTHGGRLAAALSTERGPLPAGAVAWPAPLPDVAAAASARWAVSLDVGVLPVLADRFARKVTRGDDPLRQGLTLLGLLRDLAQEGALQTSPRDVGAVKLPSERTALRALDTICPTGRTVLLAAYEGADLATCVALHRRSDGIDRIVGPVPVRRELGLLSGDWARDTRGLCRAMELAVGTLSLGAFAQVSTWRSLLTDPSPGAFAARVASRDLVLHPVAPALAIPLGLDVGRAAFSLARELAERIGASSLLREAGRLRPALERVREVAGADELERLLGFDPLALLRSLLGAARP